MALRLVYMLFNRKQLVVKMDRTLRLKIFVLCHNTLQSHGNTARKKRNHGQAILQRQIIFSCPSAEISVSIATKLKCPLLSKDKKASG